MVFVIDGPAGSGKSSTAREIARRLSITYLDSGAIYRAVTWLRQRTGEDGFFDVLKSSTLSFQYAEGVFRISVNGTDVTQAIRTPEIDAEVSAVAADGRIRDIVNGLLREATREGYYIADGRDLGTVVFPDAAVKIFMVADIDARARRRYAEQQQSGISRDEIAKGLQERDRLDSTREVAPLRKADDAIELDTTSCTFEEQVAAVEEIIKPFLTETNQNSSRLNKAEVLNKPTLMSSENYQDANVQQPDAAVDAPQTPSETVAVEVAAAEAAPAPSRGSKISAAERVASYSGKKSDKVYTLDEVESLIEADSAEEDARMRSLYESTLSSFSEKEIVTGRVRSIDDKYVIVDIGFKSEGIIPINEFRGEINLKPGDEIEVFLDRVEDKQGQLLLSRKKAETLRTWQTIEAAFKNQTIIEGYIKRRIKGGMVVDIFGIDAFLPGSQIDIRPVRDFDAYVGKTMEFMVVKLNMSSENVVVSHRAIVESDLEDQRKEILASIEPGQILEGHVKNITDFGVFIDLGGVDGLLHITDLSWGRVEHPSEIIKLDQNVNVVVLDFDTNNKRISLGLKQLQPHPWDEIDAKYPEGDRVQGRVVSIADYGAFVELERGVEGLIHISEMSWTQHVKHPSQLVEKNQTVECVVLNVNKDEKKISLGVKQLVNDPWHNLAERYPIGKKTTGIVRNLTNFGVFVELEPGIDGLIHISDLSWTEKVNHPSEVVSRDQTIDVVVLAIDFENRRITLGHKQALPNPWEKYAVEYAKGKEVEATISRFTERGAFVKLPLGVEAFFPANEAERGGEMNQSYKGGEKLTLRVIEFDEADRSIIVSEKALHQTEQKVKKATKKAKKDEDVNGSLTLGEMSGMADLKKLMDKPNQ